MVHNSLSCPRLDAPLTGTRLLYAHLQFHPQKCRKPVKNQKIRYKSVIKKSVIFKKSKIDFKSTGSVTVSLQPLATITHAYFPLYMLSTKRNSIVNVYNKPYPVYFFHNRYNMLRIEILGGNVSVNSLRFM